MAATIVHLSKHVRSQRPTKLLINNEWVGSESGKTFATFNPATGEEIAQFRSRCRRCRQGGHRCAKSL